MQTSYHLDVSDVTYTSGRVQTVEKVPGKLLSSLGYGFDRYGNHTLQVLQYLTERFGPIKSFTGTSRADYWTLNIEREPFFCKAGMIVHTLLLQ